MTELEGQLDLYSSSEPKVSVHFAGITTEWDHDGIQALLRRDAEYRIRAEQADRKVRDLKALIERNCDAESLLISEVAELFDIELTKETEVDVTLHVRVTVTHPAWVEATEVIENSEQDVTFTPWHSEDDGVEIDDPSDINVSSVKEVK